MENETAIRNPFGECCRSIPLFHQITCAHDGCNAKVHRDCQWAWLKLARLQCDTFSPCYCPTHNRQRGEYITWYYKSKKQHIPDSLKLTTSNDVGLINQGTLSSTSENLSIEAPSEFCVICLSSIDATTSVTSSCNHTFHYACVSKWMENEVSYTCDFVF